MKAERYKCCQANTGMEKDRILANISLTRQSKGWYWPKKEHKHVLNSFCLINTVNLSP